MSSGAALLTGATTNDVTWVEGTDEVLARETANVLPRTSGYSDLLTLSTH